MKFHTAQETIRLTLSQAIVKHLQAQHSERDGVERRIIQGVWGILRLLSGGLQLAPAPVELPLQRTRPGTGIHFRPAKFFRARFGRIRPRPLLFEPRPPVTGRLCRYDFGGRPVAVVPDSEIRVCAEIFVAHRKSRYQPP